jgi:hypothetical protein
LASARLKPKSQKKKAWKNAWGGKAETKTWAGGGKSTQNGAGARLGGRGGAVANAGGMSVASKLVHSEWLILSVSDLILSL